MVRKRKPKAWVRWCGFVDGRPDAVSRACVVDGDRDLNQYGTGLFTSRKKARGGYDDVRRVRIVVVPSSPRKVKR